MNSLSGWNALALYGIVIIISVGSSVITYLVIQYVELKKVLRTIRQDSQHPSKGPLE